MYLFAMLKKTFSRFFLWLALILLTIAPIALIGISHPHYLQNMAQIISQNKLIFTTLRWSMILMVFWTWPRFIRHRAKHGYWKPEKTMFWLNQRLKITFWLIAVEVLICQNLVLTLIRLLEGR